MSCQMSKYVPAIFISDHSNKILTVQYNTYLLYLYSVRAYYLCIILCTLHLYYVFIPCIYLHIFTRCIKYCHQDCLLVQADILTDLLNTHSGFTRKVFELQTEPSCDRIRQKLVHLCFQLEHVANEMLTISVTSTTLAI